MRIPPVSALFTVERLSDLPALLKVAILRLGGLLTTSDPRFDLCVKNEQENGA